MPDAGRTREPCVQKSVQFAHASNDRFSRNTGIPCAMGYGLYAVSSVRRAFWPPSPARSSLASLIPASGDRDNTTSPSASNALVCRAQCVHRIPPPTFVTIAKRPSWMERDGWRQPYIYEKRKKNIFAGEA